MEGWKSGWFGSEKPGQDSAGHKYVIASASAFTQRISGATAGFDRNDIWFTLSKDYSSDYEKIGETLLVEKNACYLGQRAFAKMNN